MRVAPPRNLAVDASIWAEHLHQVRVAIDDEVRPHIDSERRQHGVQRLADYDATGKAVVRRRGQMTPSSARSFVRGGLSRWGAQPHRG